jgi:hypothetical protein
MMMFGHGCPPQLSVRLCLLQYGCLCERVVLHMHMITCRSAFCQTVHTMPHRVPCLAARCCCSSSVGDRDPTCVESGFELGADLASHCTAVQCSLLFAYMFLRPCTNQYVLSPTKCAPTAWHFKYRVCIVLGRTCRIGMQGCNHTKRYTLFMNLLGCCG